jgi:pyridoxamine 5'-phosphate oxidase
MSKHDQFSSDDPVALFQEWLRLAEVSEPNDPNAAALATAAPDGHPSVRMVLIKGVGHAGFTFYTNVGSQKGSELTANPRAEICFHWKSLRRQVRVSGSITLLSRSATEQYFHSRSRRSQVAAAISEQSRPLPSRELLERKVDAFEHEHAEGDVPLPSFWQGYLLEPNRIEFWISGDDRLHDRVAFLREDAGWRQQLLYP